MSTDALKYSDHDMRMIEEAKVGFDRRYCAVVDSDGNKTLFGSWEVTFPREAPPPHQATTAEL